jgi:hypothetical protein
MMSCPIWHITTRSNRSSVFGSPKDLNSSRSHIASAKSMVVSVGSSLFGISYFSVRSFFI